MEAVRSSSEFQKIRSEIAKNKGFSYVAKHHIKSAVGKGKTDQQMREKVEKLAIEEWNRRYPTITVETIEACKQQRR